MKTVLMINHYRKACGVQQFGRRVFDLVKNSTNIKYIYREMETKEEFVKEFTEIQPNYLLYNWHRGTMPWLSEELVRSIGISKHYFLYHEEHTRQYYDKYLFFGDYDFSGGAKFGNKRALLPRPLLKYHGDYPKNDVTTIGCFGFGFWNKGYHTLTKLVNDAFPKAVLNLHMPYSFFGDPLKEQTSAVEAECRKLATNPGLRLHITHDFLDDGGVLHFLANNDINVFLYGENGEGISSVIDYALSVKRPIGISGSRMFRHIMNDNIRVDKNSIESIISRGTTPLEPYYIKWNIDRFSNEMDEVFNAD